MIIGVIGGNTAADEVLALAYEVGREIGARGLTLVCGGREGVMREACRGAREAGGTTVAILPGNDLVEANEYVDIPILTGLGEARNSIITKTANALIAVGGAYGTLIEIAFALHDGRPVIGLDTWHALDPLGEPWPVLRANDAAEAVTLALEYARPHPGARE